MDQTIHLRNDISQKEIEELERSFAHNEIGRNIGVKIAERVERDFKELIFSIGDFNTKHYKVVKEQTKGPTITNPTDCLKGSEFFRYDSSFRFDYIATEKQRKEALRHLKRMYGKEWKTLVPKLHPQSYRLMSFEEYNDLFIWKKGL